MKLNFKHRQPFLYLEHARLYIKDSAVHYEQDGRSHPIPIRCYTHLMLGPGTSMTHDVVVRCTAAGTTLVWVAAEGVQMYAATTARYESATWIQKQVGCLMNKKRKLKVAHHLYGKRFGVKVAPEVDLPALRGMEGSQCKKLYAQWAEEYRVPWEKRLPLKRCAEGEEQDPINRMIDAANGCLIGSAMVSVVASGMSPALGFIHHGFERAFACDIADLYKFDYGVKTAFQLYGAGCREPAEVRKAVKARMASDRLLGQMIEDAREVVDAGIRR